MKFSILTLLIVVTTIMASKVQAEHRILLCSETGSNTVRMIDSDGRVAWEIKADGNTLASYRTGLAEFDPKGNIVWHLAGNEIPQVKLHWLTSFIRLANGNTLISNWRHGNASPEGISLFEVTKGPISGRTSVSLGHRKT